MSLPFVERASAETFAERLRSLAHPVRLMILGCLADGERSVAELEKELELRQPSLSQQLSELRQAEWVTTRRQAKSVFYRLARPDVHILLTVLASLLGDAEVNRAAVLETLTTPPSPKPAERHVQAAVFAITPRRVR